MMPHTRGTVLSAEDRFEIEALHKAWMDAELRGDSSALLQLCAAAPVWLPPNEAPLCGAEAIRRWLEDQPQATVRRIDIDDLTIHGIGSFAWKLATFRTTLDGPADAGVGRRQRLTRMVAAARRRRRVADRRRGMDHRRNGSSLTNRGRHESPRVSRPCSFGRRRTALVHGATARVSDACPGDERRAGRDSACDRGSRGSAARRQHSAGSRSTGVSRSPRVCRFACRADEGWPGR